MKEHSENQVVEQPLKAEEAREPFSIGPRQQRGAPKLRNSVGTSYLGKRKY